MRDADRSRRAQSGVLLGLAVGPFVCVAAWLCLRAWELIAGAPSAEARTVLAGAIGLGAMLASAHWGGR